MKHISEVMDEWMEQFDARIFTLWMNADNIGLRIRRGGVFKKVKGAGKERFLFSSFDRDDLEAVRACLVLAVRGKVWREHTRACLVSLFEARRLQGGLEIKMDIRRRGLNDMNAAEFESLKRLKPVRLADHLMSDFFSLIEIKETARMERNAA